MLAVLREFGGISFIFDLKEGEVFLGTLNGLKERQKFETLVSDRSGGEVTMALEIQKMVRRLFCRPRRVNMPVTNWRS